MKSFTEWKTCTWTIDDGLCVTAASYASRQQLLVPVYGSQNKIQKKAGSDLRADFCPVHLVTVSSSCLTEMMCRVQAGVGKSDAAEGSPVFDADRDYFHSVTALET